MITLNIIFFVVEKLILATIFQDFIFMITNLYSIYDNLSTSWFIIYPHLKKCIISKYGKCNELATVLSVG